MRGKDRKMRERAQNRYHKRWYRAQTCATKGSTSNLKNDHTDIPNKTADVLHNS